MPTLEDNTLFARIKKLNYEVEKQLSHIKNHFDQYAVIDRMDSYLDGQLSQSERMGLCAGLSGYYLYSKLNNRGEQFFKRLATVAHWDKTSVLDESEEEEFSRLINYTRWLHKPGKLLFGYHQLNLDSSLMFIKQDDEPAIQKEYDISSLFTEKEFIHTFNQLNDERRLILLTTGSHAMGLYMENNLFYFYDPDFIGGCELQLNSIEEVYAWLVFASVNYSFKNLEENYLGYIPLGLNLYIPQIAKPSPLKATISLIEGFIENDSEFLKRKAAKNDQNILFLNCITYEPTIVERLLKEEDIRIKINDRSPLMNFTPLLYCCQEGYADLVEMLLKAGADANQSGDHQISPLQLAIDNQHPAIVKLLIEYGANIQQEGTGNSLPIQRASTQGNLEAFEYLWNEYQKGLNTNLQQITKDLLVEAIDKKNTDIVDFLLKQNVTLFDLESSKTTLLSTASASGSLKVVRLLSSYLGFDEIAVIAAAQVGQLDIVKYFLEANYPITETTKNKCLWHALRNNKLDVAEYLLMTHSATCESNAWLPLLASPYNPQIFNLLLHALDKDISLHKIDLQDTTSLGAWALINQNCPKEVRPVYNCVQKILTLLDNLPTENFLAKAVVSVMNLRLKLQEQFDNYSKNSNPNYFFYRFYNDHTKVIANKKHALTMFLKLLTEDPTKPIAEITAEVEKKYPLFLSGILRQREKNLIEELELDQVDLLATQNRLTK